MFAHTKNLADSIMYSWLSAGFNMQQSPLKSLNMHRHYAETQFKKKIENLLWIPYPVKLVQHFISSNPDWSRAHA